MLAFAPEATTILFAPSLSTIIRATPDGVASSFRMYSMLIPSVSNPLRDCFPKSSSPMQAINVTSPPALAAATA